MERDGLYRWPAIASMAAIAADVWPRSEAVEVDANQTVERVDQRDRIRATLLCGMRHVSNVGYVGCELYDHWNRCDFLHPRRDHGRVLRYLADCCAHTTFRHAVRA